MTEHQISVIRRHMKENPTVESNVQLARIIERKSKLGLSVGSLQKYISKVKAMPNNVVETKAKSLIKGDTPRVKNTIKKDEPKCPTVYTLYFSYNHLKDQDLINHIDTVLAANNIIDKKCDSLVLNKDLTDELTAYGVIISRDKAAITEFGADFDIDKTIEEEKIEVKEPSTYSIALKDPSHYTPADSIDKVMNIHEYTHLYQGFLDLLSLAIPTEAVETKQVTLYIDVKYHTPGTSDISIDDAKFYLSHFRNSFNAKIILVADQDDFDLVNSFKGFVIDEVKFKIFEEEEEFQEEYEDEDEDFFQ